MDKATAAAGLADPGSNAADSGAVTRLVPRVPVWEEVFHRQSTLLITYRPVTHRVSGVALLIVRARGHAAGRPQRMAAPLVLHSLWIALWFVVHKLWA